MNERRESRIVIIFKSIFTFRKWLDYDRMKAFTLYLIEGVKHLFVPQRGAPEKTFDEVIAEQNINEETLNTQKKALFRLSLLMCVIAVLIFAYIVYQIIHGGWLAVMVSIVVMLLALSLAFRYHFWYYQIKIRRLDCTVKEWYRHGLLGEK